MQQQNNNPFAIMQAQIDQFSRTQAFQGSFTTGNAGG
jgi:hypothetical protein